jgi:hypothetical protein
MNITKIFLFLLISTIIFVGYKIIIKYNRLETFKSSTKPNKHKKNSDKHKKKSNKSKKIVKEDFYEDDNNDTTKPIIGVAANYNKNENKITALQYFYDKNKVHNSKKYDIGIKKTGTSTNETIGEHDTGSDLTEKYNFMCPPNSAINKVEGSYDSMGIRGLKFYCQDITTGKQVKAYNNNNRLVDGVTFGIEPNPSDENYHYDKSECHPHKLEGMNKQYPTFISNIDGTYNPKKENITNVSFNQCSLYYDN